MDLLARFVGIWMVFAIHIEVGVEGINFGADCSSNACTETNTICDPGTPKECICNTGFFRKSTKECATKIALTQECTAGQPRDQCSDSNAECDGTAFKCKCKPAHFVNKTGACNPKVTVLDGTCDATDSSSDQCTVTNAECRNGGTGSKCLCKATHYVDGTACTLRKKPDEACTANQCVTHAACDTADTHKCVCEADYIPSPTISPTLCSGVVKVTTMSYMYVITILVSMMFLIR